jgi:hypothetical protein
MKRYVLTYYIKGKKHEIVSQYFNQLLALKKKLVNKGITVLFWATNETLREDLKPI